MCVGAFKGRAKTGKSGLRRVLGGEKGAQRDIVCLNAAGALYAARQADTLAQGIAKAEQSLDSGAAAEKLSQLIERTQAVA